MASVAPFGTTWADEPVADEPPDAEPELDDAALVGDEPPLAARGNPQPLVAVGLPPVPEPLVAVGSPPVPEPPGAPAVRAASAPRQPTTEPDAAVAVAARRVGDVIADVAR